MTIDQSALGASGSSTTDTGHLIEYLRRFSGVEDAAKLRQALVSCRLPSGEYNVQVALDSLIKQRQCSEAASSAQHDCPPAVQDSAVEKHERRVRFESSSSSDDLRRAIELSMREHQRYLTEQRMNAAQHAHSETTDCQFNVVQGAPASSCTEDMPNQRGCDHSCVDKREKGCPVALQNVGNTCWFSSVIQALFHLPAFRRLVLNYQPASSSPTDDPTTSAQKGSLFMVELQRLFALLSRSVQCAVDPSPVLSLLRAEVSGADGASVATATQLSGTGHALSSAGHLQQDVSEFLHKLLELLEEAFTDTEQQQQEQQQQEQQQQEEEQERERRRQDEFTASRDKNPMIKMFYGQHRYDAIRQGELFSHTETFGQLPLSVTSGHDLYSALEDFLTTSTSTSSSTSDSAVDHQPVSSTSPSTCCPATDSGAVTSSQQQHADWSLISRQWFTVLPPVLLLELKRFKFDHHCGRVEKIHDRLTFPELIYMDRFLATNRTLVAAKHRHIQRLRVTRDQLAAQLQSYKTYGEFRPRVPLSVLMRHLLQYVNDGCDSGEPSPGVAADYSESSENNQLDNGHVQRLDEIGASSCQNGQSSRRHCHDACHASDNCTAGVSGEGASSGGSCCHDNRHQNKLCARGSQQELAVVRSCLSRWLTDVDCHVAELRSQIELVDIAIADMYNEPALKTVPYQLHAVLVHEGEASSGHYWAYLFHRGSQCWMKFNDVSVNSCSWEEVSRESVGGHRNTSAYCLIYCDIASLSEQHETVCQSVCDDVADMKPAWPELSQLLQRYVHEHNTRLQQQSSTQQQLQEDGVHSVCSQRAATFSLNLCAEEDQHDVATSGGRVKDPSTAACSVSPPTEHHHMVDVITTNTSCPVPAHHHISTSMDELDDDDEDHDDDGDTSGDVSVAGQAGGQWRHLVPAVRQRHAELSAATAVRHVRQVLADGAATVSNDAADTQQQAAGQALDKCLLAERRRVLDECSVLEAELSHPLSCLTDSAHSVHASAPSLQRVIGLDARLTSVAIFLAHQYYQHHYQQHHHQPDSQHETHSCSALSSWSWCVHWALLEQFAQPAVSAVSGAGQIHSACLARLAQFCAERSDVEHQRYTDWHTVYSQFRRAGWLTLTALNHHEQQQYTLAVQHMMEACNVNKHLLCQPPAVSPRRCLQPKLLANIRRSTIQCLNQQLVDAFVGGDRGRRVVHTCVSLLAPALLVLESSSSDTATVSGGVAGGVAGGVMCADRALVESVRTKWYNLLELPFNEKAQMALQSIISSMMEPTINTETAPLKVKRMFPERELAPRLRDKFICFKNNF